ncbi:GntR family transcriptional regulator [Sphaerotilus hippei]|uniref:GntR family transcriptional regulator n=1 Tax=Sphaerotilus hippei TaxID=744406 RepID=A0A318HDA3_9BURK|nr:FadR/GntR family transcriptional regulator [Sphaerotilus hippei]PXW97456.1 GntR family transcriptional regulator [Sphaerotilus hippei]
MDTPFPLDQLPSLRVGARLSEQLAEALVVSIRDGQLPPGQRLPTESALATRFGVSRTVVREALSSLKTLGLIESRQGSGAFVRHSPAPALEQLTLEPDGSMDAVIQMVEVRRALEAESAALAAVRRSGQDLQRIKTTLAQLDRAVAAGGDGVAEDVAFHAAIAAATRNPFLLSTLAYLNHFLLDATRVTRANEATRSDLEQEVRQEHAAIVAAIEAGDSVAARRAGTTHMVNAAERIGRADPAFWAREGLKLADLLRAELGAPQAAPSRPRRR